MHAENNEQEQALVQLVCAIVSIEFGVPTATLLSMGKGRTYQSFARHVAMYLMHVVFQTRISGVGRAFGRDPSTAGYACRAIENEREDPLFDQKLQKLEEFLNSALAFRAVQSSA